MRPTRIRYFGRSGISRPSLLQIFHKIIYFYISGSHMCLRYEKIICYDWIIQRLLELFVCTDFIFIVILTSSTIYFCSIFRYLLAIINIYTHTFKYLSINIYKYLYFWRNSQIHIFVSVCCVCRGQLNVCLSKSYKAHSTEQHPPPPPLP